jgi:hypothetical protein
VKEIRFVKKIDATFGYRDLKTSGKADRIIQVKNLGQGGFAFYRGLSCVRGRIFKTPN